MDKEFIDGYVKLPYDNNKFIRWIDENELEMIEKKIIHISNEIIADESVDIIKYIEDNLKSETDHYKQQRDSLKKDVEKLRDDLEELKKYNYELELAVDSDLKQQVDKWFEEWHDTKVENDLLELELQETKEDYRIVNSKYTNLTNHIKDKAINNPGVSRYIDLVHFIDDLERD